MKNKIDTKPIYVKCPRCDLNYINAKDGHCNVCKAEMRILDPSFLLPDEDVFEEGEVLCPVCNINFCEDGASLCIMCIKDAGEDSGEKDWEESVEGVVIEDEPLPLPEDDLGVVEGAEEEEVEESQDDEDFEYVIDDDDFDIDADFEDEDDEDLEDEDDFDDEDYDDDDIDSALLAETVMPSKDSKSKAKSKTKKAKK
ncbi:MAG: hypothetical protein FWC80_06825 [Firmicutes bacterium]|nr:hypothetical protein [Bacillota bacterium]